MAKKKKKKKQLQQKKRNSAAMKAKKKTNKKKAQVSAKKKSQQKKSQKPKKKEAPAKPKHSKISIFLYRIRRPIIAACAALAILLFFQISSVIVTVQLLDRAAPGTIVAGIDMSSKTTDEVQNALIEKGQPFLDTPIIVTLNKEEAKMFPLDLGIELEPRSTMNAIKFVKFDNSNLATIVASAWNRQEVDFQNTVDIENAIENIEKTFAFDDVKTKNAYLAFEGSILTIVPEKEGKAINTKKLFDDIKVNASSVSSDPIEIEMYDFKPLVTAADLESQLTAIKEKLNKQIILNYENFNFNIRLINYIDWVRFGYEDKLNIGDYIEVSLDLEAENIITLKEPINLEKELKIYILKEPFEHYINEELSPLLEMESEDVKIYYDENQAIIIEGKGENGQTINRDFLLEGLILAANRGIDEVPIPIKLHPVNVDISENLQELGIETLISTGRSAFAGSTSTRIHNINTGINKFQGHLIPPGETFSFNQTLGPVEYYTGYKPELVIKAEGTIPELGGGLCQVSSTMYRAALFAGLPIVERDPHSYAVSYYSQVYGYGMDSTIYPGVKNLRFINDTPGHILIQGYTEGVRAYFKFYGTSDGRNVEMEGPYLGNYIGAGPTKIIETTTLAPGQRKQMEISHTGFDATWYRHLTNAAGETIKETIFSRYHAIPAKVLVGAGAVVEEEEGGEETFPE